MEERNYETFESFLSVLGIGKESCKIVAKLSNERFYINEKIDSNCKLQRSNFICIKGLTNIESLQNYLANKEHIWYVMDSGRAYQDLTKEVLKTVSQKEKFSLLFVDEKIDKEFIYSLRGKGYINHSIEIQNRNPTKVFQALKGLLYGYFIPSLPCVDITDIKFCFSFSPIVKFEIFEIPKSYFSLNNLERKKFFSKVKKPISAFLEFFVYDETLDEIYEVVGNLKDLFSLDENKIFFTTFGKEKKTDKLRILSFWTEEE